MSENGKSEIRRVPLTPIITKQYREPESWTLQAYQKTGGYAGLEKAKQMEPAQILDAVKQAGVRGRGGAGFGTGLKWSFLPPDDGGPRYLTVNCDESEPGTCKDIPMILANPHAVIEGVAITCLAIGCDHAFIYIRGEVVHAYNRLLVAIKEAEDAGLLGELWLIARPLQVPNKQRRWFAVLLGQGSEFAFVVFGAAQMANVLEPEWAKSLTLAVALSMAATPILLVILNRLEQSSTEEAREADEIDEEQPRVIIAGFGRFGQITGRLLLSSGVKMVVLDHDPDHIETLRKFGMKVFYGDATRMDLLESAGAAKAEVLINAIDDPQTNLQLTEMVKEHFPHLQIIARARDVDHYIRLRQAGVEKPERETFEGALKTGRLALESLGLGPYEARERADVFRRFNIQMVEEMAMVENDTKARAAVYKRTSATTLHTR